MKFLSVLAAIVAAVVLGIVAGYCLMRNDVAYGQRLGEGDAEVLVCSDESGSFVVNKENVYVIVEHAMRSADDDHPGVVGQPVGIILIDDTHMAHVHIFGKMPSCAKADQS